VAAAEPEVRDRQRLVDGRVERDGDDHAALASLDGRRDERIRRRRASSNVPTIAANPPISTHGRPAHDLVRWAMSAARTAAAAGRAEAAISGAVATVSPCWTTSMLPSRWPLRIGPLTSLGEWTCVVTASRWPRRTIRRTVRAALSLSRAPWRNRIGTDVTSVP